MQRLTKGCPIVLSVVELVENHSKAHVTKPCTRTLRWSVDRVGEIRELWTPCER